MPNAAHILSAVLVVSSLLAACSESSSPPDGSVGDTSTPSDGSGGDSTPPGDSGTSDTAIADSGAVCTPVTCEIACTHGFARDPVTGCEICECAEEPDDSCTAATECVLARDASSCCDCYQGHSTAQLGRNPCLVTEEDPVPVGCQPDPDVCAAVDCARCEPFTGASCSGGVCIGTND